MNAPAPAASLMSGKDFRESLRRYKPRVFLDGRQVGSVADEPGFGPGINAIGLTYDYALKPQYAPLMTAVQHTSGKRVNRLSHINTSSGDLLNKLEAVRLVCQETGCAQRYLTHDALNAIGQVSARIDDAQGSKEHSARFLNYLHRVQDQDLTLAVAMTDAKGDRSRRPHEQANVDSYVHVVERNAKGIVISGTKAIVTGAPYVHEFLVMPCRNMGQEDADFAICCAVPVDAPGITIIARPAGRPGEKVEHGAALFSRKYGQSTGVVMFDKVFVPWESVFYDGSNGTWEHSGHLTYSYATHHRHTCIGARAGFGDLLIGAGALMCEANGFDPGKETHLREQMVELITITESFYACGVAASVYGKPDEHSKTFVPDAVFSNIGKLLLATKIYDMHRIAHYVSGGLIVTLPGPDEDHNPETGAKLSEVLRANPDVPYEQRIETARFIEDLTAGYQGGWYSVISLHGGGSPAAMKQEIYRNYPVGSKVELVERILERGVNGDGVPHDPDRAITKNRQPGKCCDTGCTAPGQPVMVDLPALPSALTIARH
ncbi:MULTISPECIES: 4-hydroxyphenylacetate 3-hydroxylase family protein [unclassified Polaromonas]|uniref:4-hydroxyphenylacetate 3-hydroxylase family protein n=1 Tax=unclassified Polaromonas TaxID=2638319 RepID=UPI000F09244D|nr:MULTISPECIES: 4-hydroxyphenylacetate 3-hydroxylase N-terminal domain-containing protein [unclassified Polaromonas]AYQ29784.1 4-hydroxyphenylacetate 3-hydroxylase [Polaromonas sp. SP1]QGJ19098.1 4-hydroxyphenylacetate 3-hydroxylase [Polaromonas sp. Pch-P]